jgi:hypothetical protein
MPVTAAGRTHQQYLDDVDSMIKSESARVNCGSFVKATFEANPLPAVSQRYTPA